MGALIARPHALVAPILVFWAIHLVAAEEENRVPSLWLVPLMVLWANLHGSFLVGPVFAVVMGVEAITRASPIAERLRIAGRWALFTLLSLVACLLTPHGVPGVLFPLELQQMDFALGAISEWASPDIRIVVHPLFLWIVLVIGFATRLCLRLGVVRLVTLLGLLYLSLKHQRHMFLLGLLSPILLATPLCGPVRKAVRASTPPTGSRGARRRDGERWKPLFVMMATLLSGLVVGGVLRTKPFYPEERVAVQNAIAFSRQQGLAGPVLNTYDLGGALIYNGIPAFIDGRADLYGDEFFEAFLDAVQLNGDGDPSALFHLLDIHGVEWTLLKPGEKAIAVLAMSDEWEKVYEDDNAVIHQRQAAFRGVGP
jgi:hypothetical protein